jgi:arylsulfatase
VSKALLRLLPLLAALSCAEGPSAGPPRAARVILITCDTLRADRLGLYGYERPVSPHLDAFARQAVVYEEAYASAPVTGPSLSSLMSGRLPDEIGVLGGNRQFMPAAVETLAEHARQAGLTTAAVVSNWVLRRPDRGAEGVGLVQGFDHYDDRMTHRETNRNFFDRTAPETTDAALEWVDGQLAADDERFFLWVHYQDPHGPYTPPEEFIERFSRPPADDEPLLPLGEDVKGRGQIPSYQVLGNERRADVYRDRYDAEIAWFDEHLGRLLDGLEERGLLEDALFVFTADHGESLGEHDYWFCHGETVYRELMRVPLVVRFPAGQEPPGGGARRDAAVAGHLDLYPTVLEALGRPTSGGLGLSLWSGARPARRPIVHSLGLPGTPKRWFGLSDGRWRLVVDEGRPAQLFDVAADPGELQDLAAAEPQRTAELLGLLQRVLSGARSVGEGVEREMSPEDLEAFRALGYLGGDDDGGR